METPKFRKNPQISQKGFYALKRRFFRRVDKEKYRKRAMGTILSHFYVTGCDVPGHMITSLGVNMAWYVWTEEETETFLAIILEKNTTAILDSKQQRNAECYKEIETEMREKGFNKPWHPSSCSEISQDDISRELRRSCLEQPSMETRSKRKYTLSKF